MKAGAVRRRRPFKIAKLHQLLRLVRESHEQPMTGEPRLPRLLPPEEIGVTFLGHSSFLLQVAGKNILIDPVLSKRLIVLRRQRRPGVLAGNLPPIDLILITHAHMDHLDKPTLRRVLRATRRRRGTAPGIVVPQGVENLVNRMGFASVHSLTWWGSVDLIGLRITMTPARHWGARMFSDTHRGYGGYVISPVDHPDRSVYHSGDTAYFEGFAEIGRQLRPQIALLPIGAYFPDSHRAVHTSPEEAVRAFIESGARWMVPMHYGTFRLGREPMTEPVERLKAEARRLQLTDRILVLSEGDTLSISAAARITPQIDRIESA